MKPLVSIIIANRNDTAMLLVTIRSCIEEFRALYPGQGEIVIADNSDPKVYQRILKDIPSGYVREGTIKVVRQDFPCLFTARELAIQNSQGEFIICLDSHMLAGRNMIARLVRFMIERSNDPTVGFAHAPILWVHQHERNARHDRDMSTNELGDWGQLYHDERPITWKGMPWICRREWFLDKENGLGGYGAFSQHHLSWGGGDMHIGIKPWLLGFQNWSVPCSPGIHIGPFPSDENKSADIVKVGTADGPYTYRVWANSGRGPHAIGFLVSCYVLGGEPMMKRNSEIIKKRFGSCIDIEKYWSAAIEYGKDEKAWLDKRRKFTMEQLQLHFLKIGPKK